MSSPAEGDKRFVSSNPGRDVQRVGTARFLGQDPLKIHEPVWAVTGNLGDSQCYVGVSRKVEAIQAALAARIRRDDLLVRLIPPAYTIGVSDGQLNGTDRMRFSLIGRELANDSIDAHLNANDVRGLVAVVACDKPPVGTLAAVLEHDAPAVLFSDGSIRPGADPETGERIDLVTAFQTAGDPDPARRTCMALHACPGQGSCGGMFTYNTMQTFIAVLGMEPLHMVAPPSDDPRRLEQFPDELVDCLVTLTRRGITPRAGRDADVPPERAHGCDRHGRLDERRAPQRGDRSRCRHRPLEGRDQSGRVQRALAPAARAHQRAAVRATTRWSTSTRRVASR